MKKLNQKLVQNRVRPYYLFQCDLSEGLSHFRTSIGKGIEIIESLRGHTSGFAVPTFVVDAPGGGGKIPIQPNYILSWSTHKTVMRNYEGVITTYTEPDDYKSVECGKNCKNVFCSWNWKKTKKPLWVSKNFYPMLEKRFRLCQKAIYELTEEKKQTNRS